MKINKQFFTMIELLIVIAIIAILAGMLLPALNQAREKARAIDCVSRQKQIALCMQLYANDFSGFVYGGPEWSVPLLPESFVSPYRSGGNISWTTAPLGQGYIKKPDIIYCPAVLQIGDFVSAGKYTENISGFPYTGANQPFRAATIGTVKNPDQDVPPLPIPFKKYKNPSQSLLGADSGLIAPPKGGEFVYFSGITNNMAGTANAFAHIDMRHSGKANIFMADGHVTSVGKELADYYFYNVRGNASVDVKFTTAILDEKKLDL